MSLEDLINVRLRKLGKSKRAASLSVSDRPDLLRSLTRPDKARNHNLATFELAAKALQVPVEELLAAASADELPGADVAEMPQPGPLARRLATIRGDDQLAIPEFLRRRSDDDIAPMPRIALPTDRRDRGETIPIKGTAAGSVVADSQGFALSDEVIERIPAPPGLSDVRGVYGIYVIGESMAPITRTGDLQIVHPGRPARIGDLVVVKLRGHAGAAGQCYIKRLAKTSGDHLYFEQTNPVATMRVMRETVEFVHRVLTIAEIFGV